MKNFLLKSTFQYSTIPRLPTLGRGYGFNANVRGNGGQALFHEQSENSGLITSL